MLKSDIASITYENELSEFVDWNSSKTQLEAMEDLARKFDVDIRYNLIQQMDNGGGLSEYALNIGGVPVLYDLAMQMKTDLYAIIDTTKELEETMEANIKGHRTEEINALIKAIDKRIQTIENSLFLEFLNKDNTESTEYNTLISEKIKLLEKKAQAAQALNEL